MRKFYLFIVALIVATGAFWATMLTTPPQTEAAQVPAAMDIYDLTIRTSAPLSEPADAF